jgi:hypothetical protein
MTIKIDSTMAAGAAPKSFPHQFELVIPESYESEDKFKAALLESISIGCGLECDAE